MFFIGTTLGSSLIFKKAPGTVSTLAASACLFYFSPLSTSTFLVLLLILLIAHFFSFPHFERKYGNDDPSLYTLDETIAIVFLNSLLPSERYWIAAFLLFRFFDILKPLGIRRIEEAKSIPSVIRNLADDVLAALYAYILIKGSEYVL